VLKIANGLLCKAYKQEALLMGDKSCPKCGKSVSDADITCPNCGTKLRLKSTREYGEETPDEEKK
jgi:uncharacterized Zn finger protein (UPF0148 family)